MKQERDTGRTLFFVGAACVAVLLSITFFMLLYFSGALRTAPKVTVRPENKYEETLRVVTDMDYEPFSYIDENGEYAGLDVELIAEIANRLNMNLELTLLDWTEANRRFYDGEADAILNMETDIIARDGRMAGTIPTIEKQYVVYGRETVSSVAELYGRKVASLHALPELDLGDGIVYIDSYAEIFEGLKEGKYEFAVCPIQVGNVFLEKLNMKDVRPSYAVSHVYGAVAISADNKELKARMDEVISTLTKEGWLNRLDRKWISNRYQSMTLRGMLESHPWIIAVFFIGLIFITVLLFILRTLDVARQKAEESSRAKTAFLSNMSHDIRTPMNAIIGYINLAEQGEKSLPEMKEYLAKIKGSSQHLLALINDVLEMSRIESGKMKLELIPIDLRKTLTDAGDMFATQMKEKDISYTVNVSNIKNNMVLCDKNRLNRVLLNLLSNAYKFTPEGGSVSVTAWQIDDDDKKSGKYELRVADSGIGMTEEFSKRVFDAFERERTSTVSGIQGTGLGMAITKGIIDMMGGSIELNTAPDRGTEFIIKLKFDLAEDSESAEEEEKPDDSAEAKTPKITAVDFSDKRVLLVEDMDINREIALMLLKNLGFTAEYAVNGQEAVDKVAASEPGYFDLVLMDIQMPVMNGYDATKAIRQLPDKELADIPIVAMTANAFSEDVKKAYDTGMNGHIAKPVDVNQMKETLTEVLRKDGV